MQNEKYYKLPFFVLISFTIITFISSRLLQIYLDNFSIVIIYLISILICLSYISYLINKKLIKLYNEYLILFILLFIIFLKYYNIGTSSTNLFLILLNLLVLIIISFFSQLDNFIYVFFNLFFKLNIFVLICFIIIPQFAIINFAPLIDDNNSINFLTIPRYVGTLTSPGQVVYIAIAMFSYYLSFVGKVNNNNNKNSTTKLLLFQIVISLIIGIFTLNRSFIVILLILVFYHFLSLKIIKKIKFIFISLLTFFFFLLFFKNYLEGFYNIYLNRFDQGFENRVSGDSGIENTINLISHFPSLLGNLVFLDNGFYILYNGKYEQPHNGILYFIGAFGLIPFLLLVILYIKIFLIIINKYKKNRMQVNTFVYLIISSFLISLTEVFIFDIINILIIFTLLNENRKKYV
jgi:O-antigen ligase